MENKNQITVFGATGKVGKELLNFLSQAGIPTIAVTRNKRKVKEIPFIEWIEADMLDKESLNKTMEGSRAVFLASSPGENVVKEQNNVIETATAMGVQHLVKLSSAGTSKDATFFLTQTHYQIEELLKASKLGWTILQPNSFMQNWLGDLSQTVKKERRIYEASGDGKKPFIDTRDIAEVAFNALTEPEKHNKKTYFLTGGEAVNFGQVATAISKAIGEKVEYVQLTLPEAKQRMEQQGIPQWAIGALLSVAEGQRNGQATFVNNTVQEILNKPPRTIDDFSKDYIEWLK